MFNLLFFPEDSGSGTGSTEELTVSDTIELLGEDDDTERIDLSEGKDEPKKGKEKPKDEDKETSEEDKDDEDGTDEELDKDDDNDELDDELDEDIITPPRRKEILAKYPQLFKDFPYLNRAYYREQQFTELFPTIKEAKESVNKAQTLDKFESDLLEGNTEKILTSVKKYDEKAFNKIVDNYTETLAKVDKQAYFHVVGNLIKDTIVSMVKESNNNGNEALKSAAAILNQFVFGTSEFEQKIRLTKEEDTNKTDEISNRERALVERQFVSSREEINTKVNNVLKATIEGNIDPKESMTPYVRRQAVREAFEEVINQIERDGRFKQVLDRLWKPAFDNNFDRASLDKIKSAFLSKARTLLPTAIKKARNEALKGLGKRVESDTTEDTDKTEKVRRTSSSGHTTSSHNSGKSDKERAKAIPAGMTTRDFLMQD